MAASQAREALCEVRILTTVPINHISNTIFLPIISLVPRLQFSMHLCCAFARKNTYVRSRNVKAYMERPGKEASPSSLNLQTTCLLYYSRLIDVVSGNQLIFS